MRRKLIALCALTTCFILGVCAQIVWLSWPVSGRYKSERLQGTVSQDYELTGFYYPASEFRWAFHDVTRIDLTTASFSVNLDSVTRTPTAPEGFLITDLDIYKLSRVNIDGNRLSFTTEPRAGVSYQFAGRVLGEREYLIKGYYQNYVGKTIVVEGRMVRMLFGFKVTESEVRFTKGSAC
jgi:hypothetical protein